MFWRKERHRAVREGRQTGGSSAASALARPLSAVRQGVVVLGLASVLSAASVSVPTADAEECQAPTCSR